MRCAVRSGISTTPRGDPPNCDDGYPLTLRWVEDLLSEHGIDTFHEMVRICWNRFGPIVVAEIRKRRIRQCRCHRQWRWPLDEVLVKINGETHYLWRAVVHDGEVLELLATKRRDIFKQYCSPALAEWRQLAA